MNHSEKKALAYIIGVALGDGNLSNPNGRATRLRITCDRNYPKLIKKMILNIRKILPLNKISFINRRETYGDISCYSNKWEGWLGWKVGRGSKQKQNVSIPPWIKGNKRLSIDCLRGLFETDGSIYKDRGYTMVNFTTTIPKLARDVIELISYHGYKATIYRISTEHKPKYIVRIARSADSFIKFLTLDKS